MKITLNQKEIAVLQLWRKLLRKASNGINMNLLTFRRPTNITITDACMSGIGGFSVTTGRAWRHYFTSSMSHHHINTIEFLASVVGIWLEIGYKAIPHLGNTLALTDNSSCVCWLKRSSFNSDTSLVDHTIACKVASLIVSSNTQLNSQHVPGAKNKLADLLSRDRDSTDAAHIYRSLSIPRTGSQGFSHMSTTTKHYLLDLLNSSTEQSINFRRTESGHQKFDLAWQRWQSFIHLCELSHDTFLDQLTETERAHIVRGFLQHLRQRRQPAHDYGGASAFLRPGKGPILGRTIRDTVSYLAEKFRSSERNSPFHKLTQQNSLTDEVANTFRAWANIDPPIHRNCDLTPKHLRFLHLFSKQTNSHVCQALADLVTGAFFFACRSCEYLKVTVRGKTKILKLHNIKFTTKDYVDISLYDKHLLDRAHYVSITFEEQKNNIKKETRTQQRNDNKTLCPVRAWARTTQRILGYKNSSIDTTVNFYLDPTDTYQKPQFFTQKSLNTFLRTTVNLDKMH
jgi:hypothetical protein